jgi:hypothetical protein
MCVDSTIPLDSFLGTLEMSESLQGTRRWHQRVHTVHVKFLNLKQSNLE